MCFFRCYAPQTFPSLDFLFFTRFTSELFTLKFLSMEFTGELHFPLVCLLLYFWLIFQSQSVKRHVSTLSGPTPVEFTFDEPVGMVSLTQLKILVGLALNGCSNCKSPIVEHVFSVHGVCFKAKLRCENKHQTTWSSSDSMFLFGLVSITLLIDQVMQMVR